MDQTFKITLRSQWFIVRENLKFIIVGTVGCELIITYYDPTLKPILPIVLVAGYTLISVIPCIIVHLQYLKYNNGMQVTIDKINRTITISTAEQEISIPFNRIRVVRIALMSSYYGDKFNQGFTPWECYQYALIQLQDGKQFIITCLLINNLKNFFKDLGIEVTKDRVFFPTVRMGRYKEKPLKKKKSADGW